MTQVANKERKDRKNIQRTPVSNTRLVYIAHKTKPQYPLDYDVIHDEYSSVSIVIYLLKY